MLKKIVLAASAAAVVLGAGTAALATSGGSGSPSAAGAPAAAPAAPGNAAPGNAAPGNARGKGHRPALRALGRALHGQWVTPDRDHPGAFVTHDAIRGEVTAVSATSITVKALDGVSQTYAVTDATKVHLRKNTPGLGKGRGNGGTPGKISDVHTGDKVAVAGTGTTSLTAAHIVDGAK